MKNVLVLGAGNIGSLAAWLLAHSGDYAVSLGDLKEEALGRFCRELKPPKIQTCRINIMDSSSLDRFFGENPMDAVLSALPFFCNTRVAESAAKHSVNYFDLTEDVDVAASVKRMSEHAATAFVPQCGLAPGFISIVANDLMVRFEELQTVKLRVGALPENPSNSLKYALTWSTNGLINEYANLCRVIDGGVPGFVHALEGYETIQMDGMLYEAFNTSGGLGTLAETYAGRVKNMNYKTLRYPGHCEKMRFLMDDLRLQFDRETLARILENSIPKTMQDVVLIFVSVSGRRKGILFEENYVKKLYPRRIEGVLWSAIQVTTASAACAVMDMVLQKEVAASGFVTQESIPLGGFMANRFGKYYQ